MAGASLQGLQEDTLAPDSFLVASLRAFSLRLSQLCAIMAWAGGGSQAWASQVEEEEEQGGTLGPAARPPPPAGGPVLGANPDAFPSLGDAAAKPRKKKDRKAISLAEFNQGGPAPSRGPGGGGGTYQAPANRGPPAADQLKAVLPTGPRERAPEDDGRGRSGFGGAGRYGELSKAPLHKLAQIMAELGLALRLGPVTFSWVPQALGLPS